MKKSEGLSLRLNANQLKEISKVAKKNNTTKNNVVRTAINQFLGINEAIVL